MQAHFVSCPHNAMTLTSEDHLQLITDKGTFCPSRLAERNLAGSSLHFSSS